MGCEPEFDDRAFLITSPTLIGISATPAEAAPLAAITWRALYVDTTGEAVAPMSWDYCIAREALTDEGTVSPSCLASGGPNLVPIGSGVTASGEIPADTCRLFGPVAPDTVPGQPTGRPVDPDETGGYYQPVRLDITGASASSSSDASIGAVRIACGLSDAPSDVATQFAGSYHMNVSPAVASLSIVRSGGATVTVPPGATASATVSAGEQVTLEASWASCTDGEAACTGSEYYLLFDPQTRALTTAREAIRVAWYATGGMLADDTDGLTSDQVTSSSLVSNAWTAPSATGVVRFWLVIRDDRGGQSWQSYALSVE